MKAVWFPKRGEVAFGEQQDPVAGPHEVVLSIRASGICHTDLEVMRGNYGSSAFPIVPGHEFAGEIAEIGHEVSDLAVGDRVVVDPNIECGRCRACRRGWAHLCEHLGAYGVSVNGGFAESCVVNATAVHKIGELNFATAALAEPMGCVLNGLSPLEGREVERALIFGAGPMGLLMALALQAKTDEILMVDPNADRLQMAQTFGLEGLNPRSSKLANLRRSSDFVVDATGVREVADSLLDYVANGGASLFFGVCPKSARISLSPYEVFRRQLSIFGTHSLNHNIPSAIDALTAIGPPVESLVTHRLKIAQIDEVFRGHSPEGSMKVQMVL